MLWGHLRHQLGQRVHVMIRPRRVLHFTIVWLSLALDGKNALSNG